MSSLMTVCFKRLKVGSSWRSALLPKCLKGQIVLSKVD